jgi:uncharacterized delta-60 repeat protein
MKAKLFLMTILLSLSAKAQDGTLDTTFGTNGVIGYSIFSTFVGMKTDYYNKVVALGKNVNGIPILVRFNSDGSLDTSFDGDGIKEIDFGNANETPASFCIFDNGTGWGYLVLSSLSGKIARILDDGSFSSTFGTNGIVEYEVNNNYRYASVNYDWANYKIILVRANDDTFSNTGGKIYRLNPNGTFDTSFNSGSPKSFYFYSGQTVDLNNINTDEFGNIYVHGYKDYVGMYQSFTVKFSTTGVQDYSYALQVGGSGSPAKPGYFFDGYDATSYLYGMSWDSTSASYKMMIIKKTANGSLDTGFGTNGVVTIDFPDRYYENVLDMKTIENGSGGFKILLAGRVRQESGNSDIFLARLNSNGTLDTSFGTNGFSSFPTSVTSYTSAVSTALNYDTGKIYTMGYTASGTVSANRYNLPSLLSVIEFQKNKIAAFPNPVKDILTFSESIFNITIYDITGRIIKSFSGNQVKIDVSMLSNGNYILNGETENGEKVVKKFIKN